MRKRLPINDKGSAATALFLCASCKEGDSVGLKAATVAVEITPLCRGNFGPGKLAPLAAGTMWHECQPPMPCPGRFPDGAGHMKFRSRRSSHTGHGPGRLWRRPFAAPGCPGHVRGAGNNTADNEITGSPDDMARRCPDFCVVSFVRNPWPRMHSCRKDEIADAVAPGQPEPVGGRVGKIGNLEVEMWKIEEMTAVSFPGSRRGRSGRVGRAMRPAATRNPAASSNDATRTISSQAAAVLPDPAAGFSLRLPPARAPGKTARFPRRPGSAMCLPLSRRPPRAAPRRPTAASGCS